MPCPPSSSSARCGGVHALSWSDSSARCENTGSNQYRCCAPSGPWRCGSMPSALRARFSDAWLMFAARANFSPRRPAATHWPETPAGGRMPAQARSGAPARRLLHRPALAATPPRQSGSRPATRPRICAIPTGVRRCRSVDDVGRRLLWKPISFYASVSPHSTGAPPHLLRRVIVFSLHLSQSLSPTWQFCRRPCRLILHFAATRYDCVSNDS
jgi:hypothetical protein